MSTIGRGRVAIFAALVAACACGPLDEAESPDPPAFAPDDAGPIVYSWPPRLEDQPRFRLVFHAYDAGLPGER